MNFEIDGVVRSLLAVSRRILVKKGMTLDKFRASGHAHRARGAGDTQARAAGIFMFGLVFFFISSVPSFGQTGEGKVTPIRIHSSRLESFNDQRKVIFTGDVVAKRAGMTLYADQMTVIYRKDQDKKGPSKNTNKEQVETIIAKGHVKITKGKRVATGTEGVYNDAEQNIVLTGNPQVWQGENMVKGDKITVFLAEDRSIVECQAGNRVEAVVYSEGGED